jgi:hypothetical protein
MAEKKVKRLLTVNFRNDQHDQIVLAEYLKTGDAKNQVLLATNAYLYPLALAQQPMTTPQELELALFQSVQALQSQAAKLINYFRLNKGIDLPPEQLAWLGLPSSSSSTQMPSATKNHLNGSDILDETEEPEMGNDELQMNECFEIEL